MRNTAPVRVTDDAGIRVIAIDRPQHRNAVDREAAQALYEVFLDFETTKDLHIAVLTGADGTFCAGADLKAVAQGDPNEVTQHRSAEIGDTLGPMGPTRLRLSKPVIAAIEGFAVAGGLELAIWADLRVAASDAVLGVFCRRWGVPLIDGGTFRLPRLIGSGRAMDLILTGREVGAVEAHEIGLVDRLAEPGGALDAAVALAASIRAHPQGCLRADRMSALQQWGESEQEALSAEVRRGSQVLAAAAEGATRFSQRRT
ncbi:MAG: crotonase/enoyl-CoA hydratase family protein [Actinomycetia bacterium]|nr:crotonase/enoyl-CoA hydratase family protein [Actinomycetes bacterium]